MPSDTPLALALAALARPIAEFHALVGDAIVQGETVLAAQRADAEQRAAAASLSLGQFADARIDASRFATLFPAVPALEPDAVGALEHALLVLHGVQARGDDFFVVEVPRGGRFGSALESAFEMIGVALGAVLMEEQIRSGRYEGDQQRLLRTQYFRTWSSAERRAAPPLVFLVDGADLQPGALLDYTDGREKIVLVVRGAAPPAPLARCISPNTFVLQTVDGSGLERLATYDGPAVAAIVPQGAAEFMHDPAGGREPWQRLTVQHLPDAPKRAVGGQSVWQMTQDLRVLASLATTPFAVPAPAGDGASRAVGADDAAERIAAWLVAQSSAPEVHA
ncbi:MAG TPA: hypothetical protein VF034_14525 [Gemmatimonadaceae bacterium]|jgi:hypothetical protein